MGYVGNTASAPGIGLTNNNAANMKIVNEALQSAQQAKMLGSGVYTGAPARLESCDHTSKSQKECGAGRMFYGEKLGCCQGAGHHY